MIYLCIYVSTCLSVLSVQLSVCLSLLLYSNMENNVFISHYLLHVKFASFFVIIKESRYIIICLPTSFANFVLIILNQPGPRMTTMICPWCHFLYFENRVLNMYRPLPHFMIFVIPHKVTNLNPSAPST